MSTSPSNQRVRLRIEAADAATEVFLVDAQFQRIASGRGELQHAVDPGLFKVRFRSGSSVTDRIIEVSGEEPDMLVRGEHVHYASSAPLEQTSTSSTAQQIAAHDHSLTTHRRIGKGSELLLFIRDPERSRDWSLPVVSVSDIDGNPLAALDEGASSREQRWAALSLGVAPGCYRVRMKTERLGTIEMFAVAAPGWQTQVFLRVRDVHEGTTRVRRPQLRSASVFMSRSGRGFVPEGKAERLSDLALQGLSTHRAVVSERELQLLADGKLENPMLGLLAAHLELLAEKPRLDRVRLIQSNLRGLVGASHPDVEALSLALETTNARPIHFALAPMLRNSWDLIAAAARSKDTGRAITLSDKLEDIASQVFGGGAWLVCRTGNRS